MPPLRSAPCSASWVGLAFWVGLARRGQSVRPAAIGLAAVLLAGATADHGRADDGTALPTAAETRIFAVAAAAAAGGLDPHARLPGNALVHGLYEALVYRRWDMILEPGLAERWERRHPQVWRFTLRRGVRFHGGQILSAADVVYSFRRSGAAYGRHAGRLAGILAVTAPDAMTIEVITATPDPLLPGRLADLYIVNAGWTAGQGASRSAGAGSVFDRAANGTGPFRLLMRDPEGETALVPHPGWWGAPQHNLDRVVFRPLSEPADRLAALMTGAADLIRPVPLRDVAAVREAPELRLLQAPDRRTLFLGMDQWREELVELAGSGRNPFTDRRVREAVSLAIDREALRTGPMDNAARIAGLLIAPAVAGYAAALDAPPPHDPDRARALLVEAGYPDGFPLTFDCPNDRYLNDAAVCRAIAGDLAAIGLTVTVNSQTAARHFEKIGAKLGNYTSFYLLGWTPDTLDAHDVLLNVMTVGAGPGSGSWNAGRWQASAVEDLTRRIGREMDPRRRAGMIREALAIHKDAIGHVPLYQPMLFWAVGPRVLRLHLPADDRLDLRTVRLRRGPAPPVIPPPAPVPRLKLPPPEAAEAPAAGGSDPAAEDGGLSP